MLESSVGGRNFSRLIRNRGVLMDLQHTIRRLKMEREQFDGVIAGYRVLLQIGGVEGRRGDGSSKKLCGDAEDCVDELALGYGIGFTDPPDLTFADRMHRFVTLNRSPGTVRRVEAEARRDPLFDKTMVLLDDLFR